MRLKPAPSVEEIHTTLAVAATLSWGLPDAATVEPQLRTIAQAMAAIAAFDVPEETEPLFGWDTLEPTDMNS